MPRITLFTISIFLYCYCGAQSFFYSEPVGNYPYAESSKIIGRVKNNIIAWAYTWSYTYDMRKSEILVYNDKMELLNRTSFESLTPKIGSVDFINEGNSFAAIIQYKEGDIYQYKEGDAFVCKLVSFDADGNILNTHVLERTTLLTEGFYEIAKSPAHKSFALLKVVPSGINGAVAIQYHFVKNDSLVHSDKIILPFNGSSSALSIAFLDNDNLIIPVNDLIIPVNDTTAYQGAFALFKVDLNDNSSINTIRNLSNGYLIPASIAISEIDKRYIVTSVAVSNNQDNNAAGKMFLWQLNKDLTDIRSDTVFAGIDSISPCLQSFLSYKLNSIALDNNTSAIIISPENIFSIKSYPGNSQTGYSPADDNNSAPSAGGGGGFYEGRVLSTTGIKELNGNGSYGQSNVAHGTTWSNNGPVSNGYNKGSSRKPRKQPQVTALAVLNVDAQNNLNWNQCFDVSVEKGFMSLMNEASFINTQSALHIIYPKMSGRNKQSIGDITINHDGSYVITPVISMNLKYKYLLAQSSPLDSNSIIIPCTIKGKLAFARLVVK